jgi:hypothetical protein
VKLIPPALLLALLAGCAHPPARQGVALDCRNFHRTFTDGWQPDGAGVAWVNGQELPLGTREFRPAGPDLGGVRLYSAIEQECGARQMAAR